MTQSDNESPTENLGCLGNLLAKLGIAMPQPEAAPEEVLPYAVSDRFMSKAELAFYRVLLTVVDPRAWVVCVKVNMADVLYVKRPHENRGAREQDRSQARGFFDRRCGDDDAAVGDRAR